MPQTPTDEQREELQAIVAEALGSDVLVCTRTWEAWSYGTMSDSDFNNAADDVDILNNVIDAVFPAMLAVAEGLRDATPE